MVSSRVATIPISRTAVAADLALTPSRFELLKFDSPNAGGQQSGSLACSPRSTNARPNHPSKAAVEIEFRESDRFADGMPRVSACRALRNLHPPSRPLGGRPLRKRWRLPQPPARQSGRRSVAQKSVDCSGLPTCCSPSSTRLRDLPYPGRLVQHPARRDRRSDSQQASEHSAKLCSTQPSLPRRP